MHSIIDFLVSTIGGLGYLGIFSNCLSFIIAVNILNAWLCEQIIILFFKALQG